MGDVVRRVLGNCDNAFTLLQSEFLDMAPVPDIHFGKEMWKKQCAQVIDVTTERVGTPKMPRNPS